MRDGTVVATADGSRPERKIVLVGMMGSGKSSVGRRVADALHLGFVDLDQRIETRSGRSIRQIFESDGEAVFRNMEEEELKAVMSERGSILVAAGGGIVIREANRLLLESADEVVWLQATPEVLAQRVAARAQRSPDHRPLADGDVLQRLQALLTERLDLYRAVATAIVDVDHSSVEQVVADVVAVVVPATERIGGT